MNDIFQKQFFDLSKTHEVVIGEFELPQHLLGMFLLVDGVRHKRTSSDLMLTNREVIIQVIVVKTLG